MKILSPEAQKAIEKNFDLTDEAWNLLQLINNEWLSDPKSTQCFDSRIIKRIQEIIKERAQLKKHFGPLI